MQCLKYIGKFTSWSTYSLRWLWEHVQSLPIVQKSEIIDDISISSLLLFQRIQIIRLNMSGHQFHTSLRSFCGTIQMGEPGERGTSVFARKIENYTWATEEKNKTLTCSPHNQFEIAQLVRHYTISQMAYREVLWCESLGWLWRSGEQKCIRWRLLRLQQFWGS